MTESPVIDNQKSDVGNERTCWVCLGTDLDDPAAEWVSPCRCSGGTKWVHTSCLHQWIDEKQAGNASLKVKCPQCKTEYDIAFPPRGCLSRFCNWIDRIIDQFSPFFGGGLLVGAIYWTATTYGAVTVMQVFGEEEGLKLIERADPSLVLIGLPAIPTLLITSRMIRWEQLLLQTTRDFTRKLQQMRCRWFGGSDMRSETELVRLPSPRSLIAINTSITRLINGGLILPTVATTVGNLLYFRINSRLERALLGGATFVILKGLLRMHNSNCEYQRQAYRIIRNFDPLRQVDESTFGDRDDRDENDETDDISEDDTSDY
ncbi:hypothetical protein ACOME3_008790 [Neoechinorhynchus agilis]